MALEGKFESMNLDLHENFMDAGLGLCRVTVTDYSDGIRDAHCDCFVFYKTSNHLHPYYCSAEMGTTKHIPGGEEEEEEEG